MGWLCFSWFWNDRKTCIELIYLIYLIYLTNFLSRNEWEKGLVWDWSYDSVFDFGRREKHESMKENWWYIFFVIIDRL